MIINELDPKLGGHNYLRVGGHHECEFNCSAFVKAYGSGATKNDIDPTGKCPKNPINLSAEELLKNYTDAVGDIARGLLVHKNCYVFEAEILRRLALVPKDK